MLAAPLPRVPIIRFLSLARSAQALLRRAPIRIRSGAAGRDCARIEPSPPLPWRRVIAGNANRGGVVDPTNPVVHIYQAPRDGPPTTPSTVVSLYWLTRAVRAGFARHPPRTA